MKVTLVLELDDDQAKAVTFAGELKDRRSAALTKNVTVMADPRKTRINRDAIQHVLTHMVDSAVAQCVGVMAQGIQIYNQEQAVIRDVSRNK